MKRFLKYFIWTVIFGLILYIGLNIQQNLEEMANREFIIFPLVVFETFSPVVIGILLRLPQWIQDIRKDKKWSVNWAKLLAVGLPALLITLIPMLYMTQLGQGLPLTHVIVQLFNTDITTITGLVFGYVLLDSFRSD